MNVAIILLAAGSSSRMGQSKQMMKVGSETLLTHSANQAVLTGAKPLVVVLGDDYEQHEHALKGIPVETVYNQEWESGMGSSLQAGIKYLDEHYPEIEATLIMVCDQPLVTTGHLKNIIDQYHQSKKTIVASWYADTAGVPALFHRSRFDEIRKLRGDQGAKKIILQHFAEAAMVDFPEGSIDLDTPDDYEGFLKKR